VYGGERSLSEGQRRTAGLSPDWLMVSAYERLRARGQTRNLPRIGNAIDSAKPIGSWIEAGLVES
jgi:hypothetical protein